MAGTAIDELNFIGQNIRRIRKEQDLSVDDIMAKRDVGITRVYWYAVERGEENPTIGVLVRMADALGVKLSTLLRKR